MSTKRKTTSSEDESKKKTKEEKKLKRAPEDQASIDRFITLLGFKTITLEGPKNGANKACVAYLKGLLDELGLVTNVYEYVPGRPVLVGSLLSEEKDAATKPSILLNSHYDVVPAFPDKWKTDPFEPVETEDGDIYGRGSQDMKCVCIQYIDALRKLIQKGDHKKFKRNIHVSFQPDEEYAGIDGMATWIKSKEFAALNVGFALDEGIANPNDEYTFFYGERGANWVYVKAKGDTGHGSRFIKNNAMGKLIRSINQFLAFRDEQEKLLYGDSEQKGCSHAMAKLLGDVTTINLTALKGGVTNDGGKTFTLNVVPMEAMAGFDIRLPPHVPWSELEAKIKEWTKEDGVTYEFELSTPQNEPTSLDPEKNKYWGVMDATFKRIKEKICPEIFPAGTDGRYLRLLNIPVIGFSPIKNTPILLHDHNEFLPAQVFLHGIDVYVELISDLGTSEKL